jgi:hypothetical protein
MDSIHRAIAKGDMTIEQMLERVPLLDAEFAAEIAAEAKQENEARIRQDEESLELDIEDDGYLPDNTAFKVERSKKSAEQSVKLSGQTPMQKLKHKRRALHGDGVNLSKRYDLGSLLLKDR